MSVFEFLRQLFFPTIQEIYDRHDDLCKACECNNIQAVKRLLGPDGGSFSDRYLNVNQTDSCGQTPLFIASKNGHAEIVALLLKAQGIDVNYPDSKGRTPLRVAVENRSLAIVSWLLEKTNIDATRAANDGWTPLCYAAAYDYHKIFNLLQEKDTTVPRSYLVSLCEVNRRYLSKHVEDGWSPVMDAVIANDTQTLDFLLQAKEPEVDRVRDGWMPLHRAVYKEYAEIVILLLNVEAIDVNKPDWLARTPLMLAANNGNVELVRLLLAEKNIDVNKTDYLRRTPLMLAAKNGNVESVRLLLSAKNIDVHKIDNEGRTALHYAVLNPNLASLRLLLEAKGIDVNKIDNEGRTALHYAVLKRNLASLRLLLEAKGIDVNIADNQNATAFTRASVYEHEDVCAVLKPCVEATNEGIRDSWKELDPINAFSVLVCLSSKLNIGQLQWLFQSLPTEDKKGSLIDVARRRHYSSLKDLMSCCSVNRSSFSSFKSMVENIRPQQFSTVRYPVENMARVINKMPSNVFWKVMTPFLVCPCPGFAATFGLLVTMLPKKKNKISKELAKSMLDRKEGSDVNVVNAFIP